MASNTKYIGKYQILKKIAKGGMGAIFLAKHPTLNRKVILKKLTLRGSAEIKARFKREAEIMMDLKNDFIVNVYDHFKEGSFFYLVVEYVEGLSLDSVILRDGALDSFDTALIAYDVARALQYIHSKGIIHRDIKPGNILIGRNGQVKLTDFGIASIGDDDEIDNKSKMEMLGTPAYMSPEHLENFSSTDIKSDVYSFGVVIYEMLTGLKPFMGELNSRFFKNIKRGRYYRVKKMNKEVSSFMAYLSRKSMHRNRKRRFSNFETIISKLKFFLKKNRDRVSRKSLASLTEGSKDGVEFKKQLARKIKDKKERLKRRKRIIINIALILFVTLLISISLVLGLPYRVLGNNSRGGLSITLPNYDNTRPSYRDFEIFRESGAELQKLAIPIFFIKNKKSYNSIPVSLSVGQYRIKYRNHDQFICNSFFIDSYNRRPVNIEKIPLRKKSKNRLNTLFTFYDVTTGKEITDSAELKVTTDKGYRDIRNIKLYSGKIYTLKVSVRGYYDDHYRVETNITDREYQLSSGLIPKPGKLIINSKSSGHDIYINGKKYYLEGGTEQLYRKTGNLNGNKELLLNPGGYNIQIGRSSDPGRRVNIRSSQVVNLSYPLDWK